MTQNKAYERLESARQRIADQSEVTGHMITAVKEGKALADDGNTYDSVQDAVDASSSYVKVGPGTFNEDISINSSDLTLCGCGRSTVINGGDSTAITVNGANVTIDSIAVQTNDAENAEGIAGNSNSLYILNSYIISAGEIAINFGGGDDGIVHNVTVEDCATFASDSYDGIVLSSGDRFTVSNVTMLNSSQNTRDGIDGNGTHDAVITACYVQNCTRGGILVDNDSIVIGNTVNNCSLASAGSYGGVRTGGPDNILANNRVDSTQSGGINDNGTGTVLDSNLVADFN